MIIIICDSDSREREGITYSKGPRSDLNPGHWYKNLALWYMLYQVSYQDTPKSPVSTAKCLQHRADFGLNPCLALKKITVKSKRFVGSGEGLGAIINKVMGIPYASWKL